MEQTTTKVWRVEHVIDERGPYNSDAYYGGDDDSEDYIHKARAMSFIDSSDDGHPPTYRDPLLKPFFKFGDDGKAAYEPLVGSYFRHGFRSPEAMLNWFHSCSLDALLAAGFIVREYTLPIQKALHGTYQSIFDHGAALDVKVWAEA